MSEDLDALLGAVDWHAVLASLVARDPNAATAAVAAAAPFTAFEPAGTEVIVWLQRAALRYHRRTVAERNPRGLGERLERALSAARAPARGRLWVDPPSLRTQLPLVGLAYSAARSQPGGTLVVVGRRLVGACGRYSRGDDAGIVEVDIDALDEPAALDAVFAHELAHALDPGLDDVDELEGERFADELGPLLLEHEPQCLTDAQPLIDQVLEQRTGGPLDIGELLDDVLTFAALPLPCSPLAPRVAGAERDRGPGDAPPPAGAPPSLAGATAALHRGVTAPARVHGATRQTGHSCAGKVPGPGDELEEHRP